VKCADLNIDPYYQRDLSRELVEKIKRNWDAAGAGYIVVNRRQNGSLYIVNGQHRVAARMELAVEAGDESGGEIVSQVFNGLTQQQEAQLRLIGNTKRTDTSQERFRAQVAAGDRSPSRFRISSGSSAPGSTRRRTRSTASTPCPRWSRSTTWTRASS
jgi:hypothetical protein